MIWLIAKNIIAAIKGKKAYPRYRHDARVLGQNYKTAGGKYVPCKIARIYTEYYPTGKFDHYYEVEILDKKDILVLSEDRLKPWTGEKPGTAILNPIS